MALRHLRDCRAIGTDRQNDPELLLVSPPPPPFNSKDIAAHPQPRIKDVVNDVAMHVP